MKREIHQIKPIFNSNSKVLILGSFPSILSRKEKFYYANPQNRFWKVISIILENKIPESIEQKTELLLNNNIALWDTIKSCEINGSNDNSITNVIENDINEILKNSNIKKIFTNGKTAKKYYDKYIYPNIYLEAICLPSTSSANAIYSLDELVKNYEIILKYIK